MTLLAEKIPEAYLLVVLNGIIGIFQNRFSYIWDQASECLATLIRRHSRVVWDKLICYFQQWLCLLDQPDKEIAESSDELNGVLACAVIIFLSFIISFKIIVFPMFFFSRLVTIFRRPQLSFLFQ